MSDLQAFTSERLSGLFSYGTALCVFRWHHNTLLRMGFTKPHLDQRNAQYDQRLQHCAVHHY